MENSFVLKECRLKYKSIKREIDRQASQLTELKWIEWAFSFSVRAWFGIEKLINQHRFPNQQDEMEFYKRLKPQFAGLIDYFQLLYKSALFIPEDITDRSAYYEGELENCKELIGWYKDGCRYYEEQE